MITSVFSLPLEMGITVTPLFASSHSEKILSSKSYSAVQSFPWLHVDTPEDLFEMHLVCY